MVATFETLYFLPWMKNSFTKKVTLKRKKLLLKDPIEKGGKMKITELFKHIFIYLNINIRTETPEFDQEKHWLTLIERSYQT